MVRISSHVISGISDDPLSLEQPALVFIHLSMLGYLSHCCIVWEDLHLFYHSLHWLLSQTTHYADIPKPIVHWNIEFMQQASTLGITNTLSDVAMPYTANAWKLCEVYVLCWQHTSTNETMN